MITRILSDRLRQYGPANAIEQEHVLSELMQHYLLASLWRSRFFSHAIFHGGTCLRILFGMQRFSEDLDFLLKKPDPDFSWKPFVEGIRRDLGDEGLNVEVQERSSPGATVQKVLIKTDLVDQIGRLHLPFSRRPQQKLRIKLEVDSNPPAGSLFETRYVTFPVTAPITTQTLESGLATKLHALLCRSYVKGRDWYDFLWYVGRGITPAQLLLGNAIEQQGPWAGQGIRPTTDWLVDAMRRRIESIDWRTARADVERFVPVAEQESVALWGRELFLYHLDQLAGRLSWAGTGDG